MHSLALTRRQYDILLSKAPGWVLRNWDTFRKRWYLGGVVIYGNEDRIQTARDVVDWACS